MSNCVKNYQSEFVKLFKQTATYHHRHRVFDDFVRCAAMAIEDPTSNNSEIQARYQSIIKNYELKDLNNFSRLLGLTTLGLDSKISDFLGEVYMQLEISSAELGQFYTPFELSKLMANLSFDNDVLKKKLIKIHEPACGSGGMILAYTEVLKEHGIDPETTLFVQAIDISETAACMAYIQLSLCGVPAEIIIGNTLSMQLYRRMYTPMYKANNWGARLAIYDSLESLFTGRTLNKAA